MVPGIILSCFDLWSSHTWANFINFVGCQQCSQNVGFIRHSDELKRESKSSQYKGQRSILSLLYIHDNVMRPILVWSQSRFTWGSSVWTLWLPRFPHILGLQECWMNFLLSRGGESWFDGNELSAWSAVVLLPIVASYAFIWNRDHIKP